MAQLRLSTDQKHILWSPLPTLRVLPNRHTTHSSDSKYTLRLDQISPWTEFPRYVLERVEVLGTPAHDFRPRIPQEFHITANEGGLQGRYAQHVGNVLGPVFDELRLDVYMADYQAGLHVDTGSAKGPKAIDLGMRQPDLVVIGGSDHVIRLVGEIKTYWTFRPAKGQSDKDYLAQKLGQLARYMDDHRCRFGFYSTYERTWFVMRSSSLGFRVSDPIPHNQVANSTRPSVRQCFLYLAALVNKPDAAFWPEIFGLPLTDLPRGDPARVQPSRSGKGKRRTLTDSMQESFDPGLAGQFWD
ncbi:hypothetical protein CNMCM5623_000839 [Aspergillus felis]|uniref:Uncharacterized protein n=1 Tax=Aspergillus felis TaxID=1287682 RepID=A0A8H6UUJ0_9EURO|nr:hypothetical protein CNMCM5623_000839 [Aspergillus felis]KAF7181162.1 hypothetical protein CNMCM7691_000291 [Aspergillus felis]